DHLGDHAGGVRPAGSHRPRRRRGGRPRQPGRRGARRPPPAQPAPDPGAARAGRRPGRGRRRPGGDPVTGAPPGPPPNPRRGRQRHLIRFLRTGLALVAVAALAAVVLPGTAGRVAGWLVVAFLVGVPVVRVGWLDVRWLRLGDRRYAAVATAVLAVVAVGAVL